MKDIRKEEIKRILIRATNWIGDSIMSLPALEAIRKNFPNSWITILLRPWVLPIFESHPAVDEVIIYEKKKGFENLIGMARIIKIIKKRQFDMAILFQNAFEAAFIAFLSGIRIRVGLNTDGRGFLLTHPIEKGNYKHHIQQYLSILKGIGIEAEEKDPILYIKNNDMLKAEGILRKDGIKSDEFLVGLAPGAMYGRAKRWPSEYFSTIGDWAIKRWGAKVIIMGSKKETGICEQVIKNMKEKAINLCGKIDLATAMAIIKRCNIFVSNDSGLMHVASCLGIPTVAIFGSTDPSATGPRGPYIRVIKHDLPCSPCLKRDCPYNLECLYSISPEEVWKEMEDMIKK